MRVVKQRLLEMMPKLQVFLDVDDMDDVSEGYMEKYIGCTELVLVYASRGYFTSKHCMRELCVAT